MKKGKRETKTSKITTKKQEEKERSKAKKPINKNVVIPVVILLIIILIGTIVLLTIRNKQEQERIQAEAQGIANAQEENEEQSKREITLVDNEHMHVERDASGDEVPVPNGYVGSKATGENEIDSGYVIYEGEEEVNDSNVAEAQKNRNQYVWIPVPDISKFYGTDANGKKWGKIYSFSTSTNSSYDQTTGTRPNNWSESNGVMSISGKTDYREPDVVRSYTSGSSGYTYDMDSRLKTLGLGASTTHEYLIQLEQEFNRMIASVEKYGGFYIGRYETGNVSQDTPVVRKGNTNINYVTWYNSYKSCKNLRGSNTNVETGMIWGNQWDRTLMWLIESGNKTKEEICNSTSWGNYSNNTETGHGIIQSTGYSENWKANNIYDLAGNVREWTMEAYDTYSRVYRGGNYNTYGSVHPASGRSYYTPTYILVSIGVRGALYIK